MKGSFKLGSNIYPSKPLKMNLKSGPRHRNDPSVYLLALICPFKTKQYVRLNPWPKVHKTGFVWGSGYCMNGIVSQKQRDPRPSDFKGALFANNVVPEKVEQESFSRGEETIHILFANLSIFAKITTIWLRTPIFWPCQLSLASPISVCWWQTMARWIRDTKWSIFLAI